MILLEPTIDIFKALSTMPFKLNKIDWINCLDIAIFKIRFISGDNEVARIPFCSKVLNAIFIIVPFHF